MLQQTRDALNGVHLVQTRNVDKCWCPITRHDRLGMKTNPGKNFQKVKVLCNTNYLKLLVFVNFVMVCNVCMKHNSVTVNSRMPCSLAVSQKFTHSPLLRRKTGERPHSNQLEFRIAVCQQTKNLMVPSKSSFDRFPNTLSKVQAIKNKKQMMYF